MKLETAFNLPAHGSYGFYKCASLNDLNKKSCGFELNSIYKYSFQITLNFSYALKTLKWKR